MTKKGETYLCEICGNKIQVLEAGGGTLARACDQYPISHCRSTQDFDDDFVS